MKFNPNTGQLFTNKGVFIKRLHCSRGVDWTDLGHSDSNQKYCDFCARNVIDTQKLDDEAVLAIAMQDASVCLKLDFDDSNLRIINHNVH